MNNNNALQEIVNASHKLLELLESYIKNVDDTGRKSDEDYWVTQSKIRGLEVLYFTLKKTFEVLEKTLKENISIYELD